MGQTIVPKRWFYTLTRRRVITHKEDKCNITTLFISSFHHRVSQHIEDTFQTLAHTCLNFVSVLHWVFPSDRPSVSMLNRGSFGNGRCEYRTVVIGQVERWKWTCTRRMEEDSYWQRQTDEPCWQSNTETRRTKDVMDAEINIFS
jgi:hypothetical protein